MKRPAYAHIVALTGAGISAESGVPTFRDANGLWHGVRIEDVATPEGFAANPHLVHEFYNQRRRDLQDAKIQPNAAHLALARLEQHAPSDFLLITQNIDNLHERAGSKNLLHLHGELLKAECTACAAVLPWQTDLNVELPCPRCHQIGTLRPHVVWFGEMPRHMEEIETALRQCDLFLAIGTSGQVYPAAGFVNAARSAHAHTIEINLEPSHVASRFQEQHYGPATEVLPRLVDELIAGN